MAEKTIRICDMCEEWPADTYTVGKNQDVQEVDLCANHGAPVRALLESLAGAGEVQVPKAPQKRSQGRSGASKEASASKRTTQKGGGSRIKVTSMEDVRKEVEGNLFREPSTGGGA